MTWGDGTESHWAAKRIGGKWKEMDAAKSSTRTLSNSLKTAMKQRDCTCNKGHWHYLDSVCYEEEMWAKMDDLNALVDSLKSEMTSCCWISRRFWVSFCFETKEGGRVYFTAIRELYWLMDCLLESPAQFDQYSRHSTHPEMWTSLKAVWRFFCVLHATRRAHNCKLGSQCNKACWIWHLNCDGTTLHQKKLQGAAINGTVNEVTDGSSDLMIADISRELQKLRDALQLPNANGHLLNSDTASTQKNWFARFGPVSDCPDLLLLHAPSCKSPDSWYWVMNSCCIFEWQWRAGGGGNPAMKSRWWQSNWTTEIAVPLIVQKSIMQ